MTTYRLLPNGVLRDEGLETQASIPEDLNNPDWLDYQTWLSESNIPLPLIEIPVNSHRKISRFAFLHRFTDTEQVTLELASIDNPNGDISQRQLQAMLRVFMRNIDTATYIDLNDQEVIQSLGMLQMYGLLSIERTAEILNAPIQPHEYYTGSE